MQLILFIGIQATGKSSFYRERFFRTHVRVNLDMLKTRHREKLLFEACLVGKTPLVVDNTNLSRKDRARYVVPARSHGFSVHAYYFESKAASALVRNAARPEVERVPDLAIRGASGRLELPALEEGFDQISFVRLAENGQFIVEDWNP